MNSKISQLTVSREQILKIAEYVRASEPETQISFEYIVGSLFPLAFKRMEEALVEEHTKGYLQYQQDRKEKKKRKCK